MHRYFHLYLCTRYIHLHYCIGIYKGEDFALVTETAAQKYAGFASVRFGGVEGFSYREGDSVCFCLPVDEYSYLLLTLLKAEGCDKTLEELAGGEELKALLSTLRIETK